eukprot:1950143-Amphidinium_carterae.1
MKYNAPLEGCCLRGARCMFHGYEEHTRIAAWRKMRLGHHLDALNPLDLEDLLRQMGMEPPWMAAARPPPSAMCGCVSWRTRQRSQRK